MTETKAKCDWFEKQKHKKQSTDVGEVCGYYTEQPYKGSVLEMKRQVKQAKEIIKGSLNVFVDDIAEEYVKDWIVEEDVSDLMREAYKDGAEFGYNKANEWHYVKDGLPKELHDVLCFVIHNEHRFVLQGYLRDGRWVLSPLGTYLNNDDVIAWKEIVLPELKEGEQK